MSRGQLQCLGASRRVLGEGAVCRSHFRCQPQGSGGRCTVKEPIVMSIGQLQCLGPAAVFWEQVECLGADRNV